jgi:hypothetical protein
MRTRLRDPVEPRPRIPHVVEIPTRAPGGEKRLLDEIVCELATVDELRNEASQLLLVAREQILEAPRIAVAPHSYEVPLGRAV